MLYDVYQKQLDDLRDTFGHRPDERGGEKWCIFRGSLVIVHLDRKPRLYEPGCAGAYTELEPNLSGTGFLAPGQTTEARTARWLR